MGESLCWFWGWAAPSRPGFWLCLAASLDVLGGAPGLPRPRMCSLPLPDVPPDLGCCAERQFRTRAFADLWTYARKAGDRSSMVGWSSAGPFGIDSVRALESSTSSLSATALICSVRGAKYRDRPLQRAQRLHRLASVPRIWQHQHQQHSRIRLALCSENNTLKDALAALSSQKEHIVALQHAISQNHDAVFRCCLICTLAMAKARRPSRQSQVRGPRNI